LENNSEFPAVLGSPRSSSNRYDAFVQRTRIENNQIFAVSFLHSHNITTRIKTNGVNSCSATREYKLKPGYRTFSGTSGHDDEQSFRRAESVVCTIAAIEGSN
jgi:hypothetical protein